MNQSICFGSLAVETACPNRDQCFLFRHSGEARVTARPPTRANQPRHHGTTAYKPKHGRDVGLRCYRFHVVPFLFVGTNSRKIKSPDAHKETSFVVFFSAFCPRPSSIVHRPSSIAHRPSWSVRLALATFFCRLFRFWPLRHGLSPAMFLTVPLNQKNFNN
jgi:hypothetical protein